MPNAFEIEIYKTSSGKEPYSDWEENLDYNALSKIDARLTRIEKAGNFGVCEPVEVVFSN